MFQKFALILQVLYLPEYNEHRNPLSKMFKKCVLYEGVSKSFRTES
jgi:hypothetical protein